MKFRKRKEPEFNSVVDCLNDQGCIGMIINEKTGNTFWPFKNPMIGKVMLTTKDIEDLAKKMRNEK